MQPFGYFPQFIAAPIQIIGVSPAAGSLDHGNSVNNIGIGYSKQVSRQQNFN